MNGMKIIERNAFCFFENVIIVSIGSAETLSFLCLKGQFIQIKRQSEHLKLPVVSFKSERRQDCTSGSRFCPDLKLLTLPVAPTQYP